MAVCVSDQGFVGGFSTLPTVSLTIHLCSNKSCLSACLSNRDRSALPQTMQWAAAFVLFSVVRALSAHH